MTAFDMVLPNQEERSNFFTVTFYGDIEDSISIFEIGQCFSPFKSKGTKDRNVNHLFQMTSQENPIDHG